MPKSYLPINKDSKLWQDTGFVWHRPDGVQVIMPTKKPRGKELTQSQKDKNKEISKVRIVVEHAIGGAKRCRIVKDRMRCHKFQFDDLVMELVCGLHNLQFELRNSALII